MKKILLIFGTRPEAIKMCPLVNELQKRENIQTVVCVTGQHRQMLDGVLRFFHVNPDHDLSIMKEKQTLCDVTTSILYNIQRVLEEENPDIVLVHGDTNTAFSSALACYYMHIPLGHVEAGLRTYKINAPFPEEFNRQAISLIAKYHFAPTMLAKENLIKEGKDEQRVFLTGNTVIDALKQTISAHYGHEELEWASNGRLIIMTAHRRENIGAPMQQMFRAVRRIAQEKEEVKIIYPIHMNPEVRKIARKELFGCQNIHIIEPLDVVDFHNFLSRSFFVLTDSGGIQEEAAFLGKPILLMRNETERMEGVKCGGIQLIGNEEEKVYWQIKRLLEDEKHYQTMSENRYLYGDGNASRKIADILESV